MFEMRKRSSRGHFVLHTGRRAISLGFSTKLVKVMLQKNLALAAFIKGHANAQNEHTTNDPIQYIHATILRVNPKKIKLEACPC
ncbi:hypothetical protein LY10_00815 [Planktotalea frisia]|jgi:hypothetical protein|uniref:Uncharacterized protein n=1 Tax=Planktotalea frisia TaxID=696762 RepID=A0A1L9NR94_9RHOB|nr:hypothetical protein PFRI_39160 [Planktotalea frisia]PZX32945.1 hypothetical protein LY10_00815 [Planktotalea frisia]